MVELLHQGLFYGSVEVELHGRISTGMSRKLDKKLLTIQKRMFSRPERTFVEIGGEDIPVTISLKRRDGGWYVTDVTEPY